MALFQASVRNKYLKLQDTATIARAYKTFARHFHDPSRQENIRSLKEESYQGNFLTDLFVNVLGYTLSPDPGFNMVREHKNQTNARKADGAVLKDGNAIAVIELKGTKTKDLESIRKQAFDYKVNQKGCIYVITSNFEKLRFYINDATDFEEFNLFTLTEAEFALLYLCLSKENIFKNLPLQLKEASIVEEDKITKQFYADYSVFKRELYRDLVKRNAKRLKTLRHSELISAHLSDEQTQKELERLEKNVKLTLFKKSQKLIDRFLFIFFAEDRGLLPPNSTVKILENWNTLKDLDAHVPLYDRFKLYFNYLDTGRKGTDKKAEIYAYNGGLFKPSTILNHVEIDDELLYRHTRKLANYDFESQVDVNILGHIFENSLNEIESVNAEIEGTSFDKQKSKRKKDGVFYTPKYITKYIVENTVGKLCEEKKAQLGFKEEEYYKSRAKRPRKKLAELVQLLDEYRDWLLQLTICDPACGSGAFLNQALDFLIKEHRYIDELKARVLGGGLVLSDIENTILENNIYGVDLNEEAVEIAKLSLWLRTAQPRRKLNDLSNNIKCGNSLIDSKAVAGDKAFNWQEEFPEIFPEKDKKAFHITTNIHDSRTSQRMIDYKVREKRAMGTKPYPEPVPFTEAEELLVTRILAGIVEEDRLCMMAYTICRDHIHMLLVCEEAEVPRIVQKIKSKTARAVNIQRGVTIPEKPSLGERTSEYTSSREHTLSREHAPLTKEAEAEEKKKRGKKQNSLWTQKYHCRPIADEQQLNNTLEYIKNNRAKHGLPPLPKAVRTLIKSFSCSYNEAFATSYKGGFDVIIGNPPYVDIKGLDKEIIEYLFKRFISANNRINLYSSFVEKSIGLLNSNGYFSFIIPSSLLTQDSYKELRRMLLEKTTIMNIVRLPNESFGGSAGEVKVDTIILTFKIGINYNSQTEIIVYKGFDRINEISDYNSDLYFSINSFDWKNDDNFIFRINVDKLTIELIKKCQKEAQKLIHCADFCLGLTPYDKYKGHTQEQIKNRVFHSNHQKSDSFGKLLAGNDIRRYSVEWGEKEWINYGEWLGAPREKRFFTNRRILVKQIIDWSDKRIWAALTDEELYNTQNAFNLIPYKEYLPEYLIAIINSKLMSFYHRKQFLEEFKDRFQKILIKDAKEFPIKIISIEEQQIYFAEVQQIISLNEDFRKLITKFKKYLSSSFSLHKLSRNLQTWHELTFGEFIKELNKAIKKAGGTPLTKKDEFEWLDLFEDNKKKAQTLKAEIDKTDAAIDQMVYKLYGLTEAEIQIVENS